LASRLAGQLAGIGGAGDGQCGDAVGAPSPQGSCGSVERGAGRRDVVHEQYVTGEWASSAERSTNVGSSVVPPEIGLRGRGPLALQHLAEWEAEEPGERPGNALGLVVAAPELPSPVERNGHDEVGLGELRRNAESAFERRLALNLERLVAEGLDHRGG
jgi:hypothetical protein